MPGSVPRQPTSGGSRVMGRWAGRRCDAMRLRCDRRRRQQFEARCGGYRVWFMRARGRTAIRMALLSDRAAGLGAGMCECRGITTHQSAATSRGRRRVARGQRRRGGRRDSRAWAVLMGGGGGARHLLFGQALLDDSIILRLEHSGSRDAPGGNNNRRVCGRSRGRRYFTWSR